MDLRAAQDLADRLMAECVPCDLTELAAFVLSLPESPSPISCYFCDRPASTMEAGYAVCQAMFHESQRRRIEAPAPPNRPDDAPSHDDDLPAGIAPAPPATLQHWTRDDGALVLSIKPTGDALTGPVVIYLGDDVILDVTADRPPVSIKPDPRLLTTDEQGDPRFGDYGPSRGPQ